MRKRVKMRVPECEGIPLTEESEAAEESILKGLISFNPKTGPQPMPAPFAFEPSAYRWEYRTPNLQIVVKGQRYAGLMERLLGVVRRFEREMAAAAEAEAQRVRWDWKEYPPEAGEDAVAADFVPGERVVRNLEDRQFFPDRQAKDEPDEDPQ